MSNMFGITKIKNGKTRLITAENLYGEKGKGHYVGIQMVWQQNFQG